MISILISVFSIGAGCIAPNLFLDRQCHVPSCYLNQISAAEALTVDLGHFKLCQESWKKTCRQEFHHWIISGFSDFSVDNTMECSINFDTIYFDGMRLSLLLVYDYLFSFFETVSILRFLCYITVRRLVWNFCQNILWEFWTPNLFGYFFSCYGNV